MALLERGDGSVSLADRVKTLKRMVISKGLPAGDHDFGRQGAQSLNSEFSLRGLVWKVLLGSVHMDVMLYLHLVGQGASWADAKIRDDTFRTFRGDQEFRRRVPEDKLSRVNNAFVRLNFPEEADRDEKERGAEGPGVKEIKSGPAGAKGGQRSGGYVQGMTVLCAPLLFVMPEVDAFYCFDSLLTRHMPRYVAANLDGVHGGCALVDRVLAAVDPVLFNYLESKFLTAAIYAFPLILSLHACIPPLEEVVKLWDVMFAFGVHLEVLVCVAQCVMLRDKLLQEPNPYQHLNARYLPPLDAELLVAAAFSLIPHIPAALMDEITRHPFTEEEPDRIVSNASGGT
ncbi:unnamed protein product [Choristocarpus tenellus]